MKLLENAHTQSEHNVLVDTEKVRIEQTKLSEDLSTTTITVAPGGNYSFTARSGMIQTYVGAGTITNGSQSFELTLFNKLAIDRGEKVTIQNTQDQIPLIVNIISAN